MSVCLTKTEIIAGSVDGTVRTFDIRIGRYELDYLQAMRCFVSFPVLLRYAIKVAFFVIKIICSLEKFLTTWGSLSTVFFSQMMVTVS